MFGHYFTVGMRTIRGAPFASLVNLLTLAVGLICFVTAYAFVTFWGAAEQGFAKASDVHVLTVTNKNLEDGSGRENATVVPDIAAGLLRSDYPAIAKIARAVVMDRKTMVASAGRSERVFGAAVDAEFLEIFDLPFVAGDSRSALASPRSVVLTRAAAARLFGADDPIGKSVLVGNSVDTTVTGVIEAVPEPSHLGRSANAPLPFDMLASRDVYDVLRGNPTGRPLPPQFAWTVHNAIVYVYLPSAGGLSAAGLAGQLGEFVARHVPAETLKSRDYHFGLVPVGALLRGAGDFFGTGLSFAAVLLLLGGLVLGVACVNYANLAAARAAHRVREIGVRKALGASPLQIGVQSLFDAAELTVAALLVALAVFVAAQPFVKRLLGAELGSSFFTSLGVWPALAALTVGVTLAAGAYPAFVLSRVRPVSAIAVSQARLGSALFSTLLVGTQFGVASFLLIAVTVISLQNAEMRRTALSAIEDPLVVIENPARQTHVAAATLRERLGSLPQVRGVTELRNTPWEGQTGGRVAASPDPSSPQHDAETRLVGLDFFDVFDVPLVAGRVFDSDHAEDLSRQVAPPGPPGAGAEPPPPVNIVVGRQLVSGLGLGTPEEAIDKLIYRPLPPTVPVTLPPMRIVGVVEDRAFNFFRSPSNGAGAIYQLQADLELTVARVAAADIGGGIAAIDGVWRELAPNVAVSRRFLDEIFEAAYAQYVRINRAFAVLAVMALGICAAGLLGMATFVAGRRRREIGVRKTLGATTARMIAMLLAGFARPVALANLVAWPAAYFAARAYLSQFSQAIELTPLPFVLTGVATLVVTCLAVIGQAVRAASTTPAEVLREA
ncbi:MAG TPA: ABC transporter permease [Gammaproteobacteria bacterium]|nr:ABC transporter permease [Gammaproteobacteria bacterium]